TLRGVPMMYYGTEIMLSGQDGVGGAFGEGGRVDFPGGWSDDATDKFAASGRTPAEERAYQYVKTLATYRKNTPALQGGRMTQFVPVDDIYVYFRYDEQTTVMVLLNTSDAPQVVNTQRYRERMLGFGKAKEVTSGEQLDRIDQISIGAHSALVLELRP
ncbi:MAG: cyclomaltodextrinase C-terminal domain-containing protein, partial [Bacteroidota bacterium]